MVLVQSDNSEIYCFMCFISDIDNYRRLSIKLYRKTLNEHNLGQLKDSVLVERNTILVCVGNMQSV